MSDVADGLRKVREMLTRPRLPGRRPSARPPSSTATAATPSPAAAVCRRVELSGLPNSDLRAFDQPVGTVDDNPISIREAAQNIGGLVGRDPHLHRLQVNS